MAETVAVTILAVNGALSIIVGALRLPRTPNFGFWTVIDGVTFGLLAIWLWVS